MGGLVVKLHIPPKPAFYTCSAIELWVPTGSTVLANAAQSGRTEGLRDPGACITTVAKLQTMA